MDIISYILSRKYTEKIAASGITSVSTEETSEGTFIVVVYNTSPTPTTIRYKIPTIQGRGIANTVLNADYTLTITYTDGTSYTTPSIRGEKGEKGEKGDPGTNQVSVSPTGTSTNEVNYITIDGVESKLAGGSDVSVSASGTSTSDVRYITIDGTESRFASVALREMKAEWKGTDSAATNITTATAATRILSDPTVIAGDGFLGTVKWKDLPASLQQAEVKAFVLKKDSSQQIVQFECTSSSAAPYAWFFNSYSGQGWQSYVPLNNTVTSTSTNAALTANMGKNLQDQITNLQNIGRFLSIWDATIGKPTTDPTTLPYTYRTGDYYRVGKVGGSKYIHQIQLTGYYSGRAYQANLGFIEDTSSAYSEFQTVATKLYTAGHRTPSTGVECTYTINDNTRNGFAYCSLAAGTAIGLCYYDEDIHEYVMTGSIESATSVSDSVSTAYIHDIDIEGTSTASEVTYVDHLTFPSTLNTTYTSVAAIAQVLQRLNYSALYPCACGGQVGTQSIYLCYGDGNELVLMDNINHIVGRLATSTSIYDDMTRSGAPNYKPTGTTYTGVPSTTEETEELEVGAVYYFDSEKWVLQKSGGGGKVQDVQINGTTIVGANTGIANIPVANGTDLGTIKSVTIGGGSNIIDANGVANIPHASVSDSGVIKTGASFNTNVLSSGYMQAVSNTYSQYQSKGTDAFIGKGTLENVLDNESVRFDKATSLTDNQKTQARTNINAIALQSYDSTATPEDGILYYVAE